MRRPQPGGGLDERSLGRRVGNREDAARGALIQQQYDLLRASGMAREAVTLESFSPEAYELEVHLEPPSSGTILRVLLTWGGGAFAVFAVLWGILTLLAVRVPLPPGS